MPYIWWLYNPLRSLAVLPFCLMVMMSLKRSQICKGFDIFLMILVIIFVSWFQKAGIALQCSVFLHLLQSKKNARIFLYITNALTYKHADTQVHTMQTQCTQLHSYANNGKESDNIKKSVTYIYLNAVGMWVECVRMYVLVHMIMQYCDCFKVCLSIQFYSF